MMKNAEEKIEANAVVGSASVCRYLQAIGARCVQKGVMVIRVK